MRWPFVFRSTLEAEQAFSAERQRMHGEQVGHLKAALAVADAHADASSRFAASLQDRYDALLDKYHALRQEGFSAPVVQPSTPEPFGPLTRAALNDMSIGLSAPLKKKMREKATELWLEQRGQTNQDEVVAIAVRRGEQVNF